MNEPLSNKPSRLRQFVRTINLLGLLVVATAASGYLLAQADAHASRIASYDLAHPGILSGWTLIAGGALPLVTLILYVVTLALILQRYKIK